ncbi:hypothetical protein H2203_008210 [Taxawa tesnikishii (nom. ined.)]|nr:hypothetical protein H2203_008210 [Dothideales sp. JES 119]
MPTNALDVLSDAAATAVLAAPQTTEEVVSTDAVGVSHTITIVPSEIVYTFDRATYTVPVPAVATLRPATVAFTAGSETYTAVRSTDSAFVVQGTGTAFTVSVGSVTGVDGYALSIGASNVALGSQTLGFVPTPTQDEAIFTAAGTTYTAVQLSDGAIVVHNSESTFIVSPGSSASIGGQVLRVDSSGAAFGPVSLLSTLQQVQATATQAIFQVNGAKHTAYEVSGTTVAVIQGQTVSAGGSAVTVNGQTVTMGSSGIVVANPTETTTVSFVTTTFSPIIQTIATVALGSKTITAIQQAVSSGIVVLEGSSTLTLGGPAITSSESVISLGSSGLVVAGSSTTEAASFFTTAIASLTEVQAIITVGAEEITAYQMAGSSGIVAFAGSSLLIGGPAITVDNTVISAAADGVVVGSTTVPYATVTLPAAVTEASGLVASRLGPWSASKITNISTSGSAVRSFADAPTLASGSGAHEGQSITSGSASEAKCLTAATVALCLFVSIFVRFR